MAHSHKHTLRPQQCHEFLCCLSSPPSGVIVLAFVLCWLPFHVGRTIFSLSLGSSADRQETGADPSSDFETLTDANKDLSTHTDSEVLRPPESGAHFFESLPQPGKLTADSFTETGERCARTKVQINAHSNYLGTDEHMTSPFSTQAALDHGNTDTSTQNPEKTSTLIETHNGSSLVNSRGLYIHKPHEDLNSTYSHPDTHVYFLYYLSQYFNLVSSILFYLSAAVNPLLYNLMSGRYRLAVRSLAQQRSRTHTHRLRTITARHSTTTL